jgi:hypothetical protein
LTNAAFTVLCSRAAVGRIDEKTAAYEEAVPVVLGAEVGTVQNTLCRNCTTAATSKNLTWSVASRRSRISNPAPVAPVTAVAVFLASPTG